MAKRSKPGSKPAPPGAKRGRKPLLENRSDRDALLEELTSLPVNYSAIAAREGVDLKTLMRFRDKFVPLPIRKLLERAGSGALEVVQVDVLSKFIDSIEKSYQMLLAADRWLKDPEDPSRYNLDPRTHEVDIVFEQKPGRLGDPCETCGHQERETTGLVPIRKTEKLSKLMRDLEEGLGITVVKGETKIADTRKLLLEAVATMRPVLEIYGESTGQIAGKPGVTINLNASPEWQAIEGRFAHLASARPDLVGELRWLATGEGEAPGQAIEARATR